MPTTALAADECCQNLLPMCRADDEAAADRAALAATAATGLVKLLVAGAADPDSGLEHGDMVKVGALRAQDLRLATGGALYSTATAVAAALAAQLPCVMRDAAAVKMRCTL